MDCKHVMVVDDDEDIREGITEVLASEGYDVYCATNGKEALEQLNSLPEDDLPGCILLDLNMPIMDGKTFIKEIENKRELAEIPVCVASAGRELQNLNLEHVVERIPKPIDIDQIYEVVHHYCGDPIH